MEDVGTRALRLLRRYHLDGDERARAELAEQMLPLARGLARRYANRGESLEDLEQVASVGLLKAIDRFDCSREVKFATFAVPTIAGEIKRHFRDKGWMIRVPRDIQELSARLGRTRDRVTRELGRPPTTAELAMAAGASQDQVVEALAAAGAYRAMSLDEPTGEGPHPADSLGAHDAGFELAEQRFMLRGGFEVLADREREILRLRFFEGLTQREIAQRVGISQMHVSRLIRRSLAALRDRIGAPEPELELAEAA